MPKGKVSTPFQKISLFNFCLPKKDLLFGEYKGTEGRRKHEEAWAPVYVFAKSISVPINPKKDDWMSLKKLMNGWKLAVENKIKDRQSPSTDLIRCWRSRIGNDLQSLVGMVYG